MLSVIVITKNEQGKIAACLESVKWADEIIVVDSESTDETVSIAKKYASKIISFKEKDFAAMRNRAMKEASGNWVLYVDADERVLKPLKEEIKGIILSADKSAYAISRRNIVFGQEVRYGPFWPDWVIRLIKRSAFKAWVGDIHESVTFAGKLGYTENSLLHLTHRDLDHIVLKSLDWSTYDAKLKFQTDHPQMSGWRFLRILFSAMINQGIYRKGFFNGSIGTMDALLQTFSAVMSYIRLWEMQQPKAMDDIYGEIDEKLLENGFNYK